MGELASQNAGLRRDRDRLADQLEAALGYLRRLTIDPTATEPVTMGSAGSSETRATRCAGRLAPLIGPAWRSESASRRDSARGTAPHPPVAVPPCLRVVPSPRARRRTGSCAESGFAFSVCGACRSGTAQPSRGCPGAGEVRDAPGRAVPGTGPSSRRSSLTIILPRRGRGGEHIGIAASIMIMTGRAMCSYPARTGRRAG
jgi:hypothetical protein